MVQIIKLINCGDAQIFGSWKYLGHNFEWVIGLLLSPNVSEPRESLEKARILLCIKRKLKFT